MAEKNLPSKICCVCFRTFHWRKKWEKVWNEVKYCSKRCQGEKNQLKSISLNDTDFDRIIRMAWEDRTPFEAILNQFGLDEKKVIELMRSNLTPSRFKAWRKRVNEHATLKRQEVREFKVGVFKSRMQRMDGSIKPKK